MRQQHAKLLLFINHGLTFLFIKKCSDKRSRSFNKYDLESYSQTSRLHECIVVPRAHDVFGQRWDRKT